MTNPSLSLNGNLYNRARQAIEGKQQWRPGETLEIWADNGSRVQVRECGRDGGGLLSLDFFHGDKVKAYTVCGTLVPGEWRFSLTERDYADWVSRVKGEDRVKPSINAEAQKWGDKLTPSWCSLSPEATKAVRAAEARRRRYQANAQYWDKDKCEWVPALVERWPTSFVRYDGTIGQTKATAWINGQLLECGPFSVRKVDDD